MQEILTPNKIINMVGILLDNSTGGLYCMALSSKLGAFVLAKKTTDESDTRLSVCRLELICAFPCLP